MTIRDLTFGDRLVIALRKRKKTARWLAGRIYMSRESVSRYVNDEGIPRADIVSAICAALGIRADWLVSGEGEMDAYTVRADRR